MFCFDKFHFLLVVGDVLEQNIFGILDSVYLENNITPPPPPQSANIEIFLHPILISTQPNDLLTIHKVKIFLDQVHEI